LLGKNAIDVGCGGGILTETLASVASNVQGIDLAEKGLAVANIHKNELGIKNIEYTQSTIEDFSLTDDRKFEVLTCMEMLEHVPSPADTVKACSNVVVDGGDLFFATINRNIKSYIMAIVGAEYILNLLPKGTHEFDCFIKPSELEKWARSANLELIGLVGVTYNPITREFSISDDVDVNYMMHFKKT
jgi:2-polyprenyl-6-hydroxyphenyl methylase/3-demethylubiquinone-9 3-methyltransferase